MKVGSGFALDLEQQTHLLAPNSADLGICGPVAIEAWIKPTGNEMREVVFLGEGMRTYGLSSHGKKICWHIGHGPASNWLGAIPRRDQWNHLAATFDGQRLTLWLNGRSAGSRKSEVATYEPAGRFQAGTCSGADRPRFKGLLDNLRIYDYALSQDEIVAHIREEAADYGIAVKVPDDGDAGAATAFCKNHSNLIDLEADGDRIRFANRQIGLAFRQSPTGFGVSRLYGIEDEQEFLGRGPPGRIL